MTEFFQAYKDMIAKRTYMDRLTGTAWCAVIDEYVALGNKIAALEAAMADLIEVTVKSVNRVESSHRDTGVLRYEYDKVRETVEYLEDEFVGQHDPNR